MIRKFVFILFVFLCISSHAIATPMIRYVSYKETLDNGVVISIYGTGFGVKNPPAPVLWDNFNGNTSGSGIGDPLVGTYSRTTNTTYTDVDPYAGDMCVTSHWWANNGDALAIGLVSNWIPNTVKNVFLSMKFKLVSDFGDVSPHNIKLLRANTAYPSETYGAPNINLGKERGLLSYDSIGNNTGGGQYYFGGFPTPPVMDEWSTVNVWAHLGPPNVATGFAGRQINNNYYERQNTATLVTGTDVMDGFRSAYFLGYISQSGYDGDTYLDDVYADTTLARIELGESSDYGSSTIKEMQLPLTWSNEKITFSVNVGRLFNRTNPYIYLFVVNSLGEKSTGYRIYPNFVLRPHILQLETNR